MKTKTKMVRWLRDLRDHHDSVLDDLHYGWNVFHNEYECAPPAWTMRWYSLVAWWNVVWTRGFDFVNPLSPARMTRTQRTVNPADPTVVVWWKFKSRRGWVRVVLIGSWGVESSIRIGDHEWWGYDRRWAKWLFGYLEDRYTQLECRHDDEMRRYYE